LALIWGSSFLWIKMALGGLSPVQISLVRLVLGALVIVGLMIVTRTKLPNYRKIWPRMVVPALFGNAIPFTLFGLGERTVDSGVAGVLNATTPLWALLIMLVIGTGRNLGAVRVIGLLLGFAGTLVIFAPWHSAGMASWGALACLVAAISYAVSYNYISKYLVGTMSPIAMSASQLGGGVLLVGVALPFAGGFTPMHLGVGPLVAVSILGVAGTGAAFVLNNRLIIDEGVATATSVGYLLPVVSVLLGMFFLHEQMNLRIVAGMVIVLVGVALSRHKARRPIESQISPLRSVPDQLPGVGYGDTSEIDLPTPATGPRVAQAAGGSRIESA
jgi:drug/metabolite transporter (DMT)-like permease